MHNQIHDHEKWEVFFFMKYGNLIRTNTSNILIPDLGLRYLHNNYANYNNYLLKNRFVVDIKIFICYKYI